MAEQHLRFPPDSTGKRVGHIAYIDITFTGGTIAFNVGDRITTPVTLIKGTVISVTGTVSVGDLHVLLDGESPAAVNNGEALQVNAVTRAVAGGPGITIYVQKTVAIGANNPQFGQSIDALGASSVRFTEGSPQFDAFGKLQVSQMHTLGDYVLRYDAMMDQFQDTVVGTGSVVHSQNFSGITISTGVGATDSVTRMSHEYHTYQPGVSQLIEMTLAVGDTGKVNVVRQWGYGDAQNGLGFRLAGTTLKVVNRSFSTGLVVDEEVSQPQWNGDRLDGTKGVNNISGLTLDVSKDNIYWIDLQWLGAGRVRFGVMINGVRITCHSDNNANNLPFSYMSTASLPIQVSQYNTGIPGSTSEIKFFCSTVKTEGAYQPRRRVNAYEVPGVIAVTSDTVPVTALMIRPMALFKGIDNRVSIFPQTFEVYNAGPDAVIFEVVRNATEAGTPTYTSVDTGSAAEVSINGTTTGGRVLRAMVIPANTSIAIDFEAFANGRLGLRRNATVSSGYSSQYYRLRNVLPLKTSSVKLTVVWEEVVK